jgi:hypothetical protein
MTNAEIAADTSEFLRTTARIALAAAQLERLAERQSTVATSAIVNLADARRMIDAVLDRVPPTEPGAEPPARQKLLRNP